MKFINFKHLPQVEETYFQHFKFSCWAGFFLCYLGIISLLHGIFPFFLSRYPDRLFHRFVNESKTRRDRVDSILEKKAIE
jgi:hypothetical protein